MDQQENSDKEGKVKQVIVIRKDLKMRLGKSCAQASHASMKVFFDRMEEIKSGVLTSEYECSFTPDMKSWFNGIFTKVCVSVNSEDELLALYEEAKNSNIPCSLITDCGLTEFHGIPTNTCIAIGPDKSSLIDPITGGLQLL